MNVEKILTEKSTTLQLVVGVIMPLIIILFIVTLSKNVPYYDQWYFIPLLNSFYKGDVTFAALWEQHYEHRLLFPRLFMLALAALTHWNIRAEIAFRVVMATVTFVLLCRAVDYTVIRTNLSSKENHKRPYVLYSLLSVLIFSTLQGDNWLWGWQIQIFMSVLATIVGFYALVFTNRFRWLSFLIAIVCGIIASFSFANGLSYWIVAAGALWVGYYKNQWSVGYLFVWVITSVIAVTSYLYDFKSIGHHPPLSYSLLHPLAFISYVAVFLGSPLCQIPRFIPISFLLGVGGLLFFGYLARKLHEIGGLTDWTLMFWHCLLAYSLLSDVLIALGRSGFGVDQALSSRYVTISNFFWTWLVVVTFRVGKHRMNAFFPKILPLAAIACAGIIALSMVQVVRVYNLRKQLLERNEAALRVNRYDMRTLRDINDQKPSLVPTGNRAMRRNKLSFY